MLNYQRVRGSLKCSVCCQPAERNTSFQVRREFQRLLLGSKKCGAQHRICIAVIWGTSWYNYDYATFIFNPYKNLQEIWTPLSWWTIMILGIKGSSVNTKNCLAILGQELEIQIQERRQEQQLPRCFPTVGFASFGDSNVLSLTNHPMNMRLNSKFQLEYINMSLSENRAP